MDGLFAKRVLIALAKKMGYVSVRRVNTNRKYTLKLVDSNGMSIHFCIHPIGKPKLSDRYTFTSSKWVNILNGLAGYATTLWMNDNFSELKITSIEKLIIDLEMEGWL